MAKQKASILGIVMGLVVLAMCAISIVGLAVDEWTLVSVDSDLVDIEELEDYGIDTSKSFGSYSKDVLGEEGEKLEDIEISFDTENPAAMRTVIRMRRLCRWLLMCSSTFGAIFSM